MFTKRYVPSSSDITPFGNLSPPCLWRIILAKGTGVLKASLIIPLIEFWALIENKNK